MGLSREKGALSPWRTSLWEFERATPTDESGRVFLPSAVARSCHQLVGPDSAYTSNLSRSVKVLDFVKSGGPFPDNKKATVLKVKRNDRRVVSQFEQKLG